MLELGPLEEDAHRTVGRRVAEVAQILIAVGQRARWIADEAELSGMPAERIQCADSNHDAIELLSGILRSGDYVLIKGSRGAAMEGIVAALQQPSERAQAASRTIHS